MKPSLKLICIPVLAIAGYVIGIYSPRVSSDRSNSSGDISEVTGLKPGGLSGKAESNGDGVPRDPRTGKTFAESRERLEELAHQAANPGGAPYIIDGQRMGKAHLEVGRIFSLASKEEVLEFFTEDDIEDKNPVLIAAAYGRLASLSLEDAALIWADQFESSGKGLGIEKIVEVWTGQDALAAEIWVDELPEGKTRDAALFTLLSNLVETAPETVDRRILEVTGLFESIHLAKQLASTKELSGLAPLAERFLSERNKKWQYQNQLVALLEVWGEQDNSAMMEWLMEKPPGTFQDHVISRVAQARMEADPAAFVKGLGSAVATNEAMAAMAGQGWLNWLKSGEDVEGALEWFQKNGEHVNLEGTTYHIFQGWDGEDALRALDAFSEMPESEGTKKMTQSILYFLSDINPTAALEFGQKNLPEGDDTDSFLASALSRMARKGNPQEAIDWATKNLDSGTGQNLAVRWIMTAWAEVSPSEAVKQIASLPEEVRKEAYSGVASEWAKKSPDKLLEFLNTSTGSDSLANLARSSFWSFGYNKGGESYVSRALELPSEKMRKEAIGGLFGGWARSNLESSAVALNKLDSGPLRDVAISEFVSAAGYTDRETALTWALAIGDLKTKREKTMDQARRWLTSDRALAKNWIEASEGLPAEWKAILLKPK